jgi:hypothetical protein
MPLKTNLNSTMLQALYDRFSDFMRWYRGEFPDGGCLDVEVYAEPTAREDVVFMRRVEELRARQEQGRAPTRALLTYFAERFETLDISRLVGCTFEVYLRRPMLVEQIRDDLAPDTPPRESPQ